MMTDIVKRLQENMINMGHGCRDVDPLCEEAAAEIERLYRYEKMVQFIANDYYEMSHDKVKWQHNDWYKRCRKLIEEDND